MSLYEKSAASRLYDAFQPLLEMLLSLPLNPDQNDPLEMYDTIYHQARNIDRFTLFSQNRYFA
jgi:type VI protein secretion system component VasF